MTTTAVLDKDENLLWSRVQRHRSCYSYKITQLYLQSYFSALRRVFPKPVAGAFSSNSCLEVSFPYRNKQRHKNFLAWKCHTKAQRHLSIYNCSSWPFSRFGARMWRVVLKVFELSLPTYLRLLYMNVFYIFWNTKIVMLTHLLKKMKSWGPLAYFLFIIDIFY